MVSSHVIQSDKEYGTTIFVRGITKLMTGKMMRADFGTFYRVKGGVEWFCSPGFEDNEQYNDAFSDDLSRLKEGGCEETF